MEELPPGWIKENVGGRTIYFSPPPERIKIDCNATLKHQQKRGKFLNVTGLNFKRKNMVKQAAKRILPPGVVYATKVEISKQEEKINSDVEKMSCVGRHSRITTM